MTAKDTTEVAHSAIIITNSNNSATVNKDKEFYPVHMPKSGRWWKPMQKSRFSSMKKDVAFNVKWEKKMLMRAQLKSVKEYQERINTARREEKLKERKRIEARRKQKAENERKSEVVQVITNPAKIKRMKKKQLRQIEKRDTSGVKTRKML